MSSRGLHHLVPEPARRLPGDLALIILSVFVTGIAIFLPPVDDTVLRPLLGVLFVFFPPGYAFVAVLFPGAATTTGEGSDDLTAGLPPNGIGGIERFTLSVGTSIVAVVLLGLVVELSPWLISVWPMFVVLATFTLAGSILAAYRRQQLPPDERFHVPLSSWYQRVRDGFIAPETRVDWVLNTALVIVIVVAVWSLGYAPADPSRGGFTELYLLTDQNGGDLGAQNYPSNLSAGMSTRLIVGVENREHERARYTLVAVLQYVGETNSSTNFRWEREVRRESLTLAHNESRQVSHNVTVQEPGRYRLNYLLYRGIPPENPTLDNAYREVHLWITVTPSVN